MKAESSGEGRAKDLKLRSYGLQLLKRMEFAILMAAAAAALLE